MDKRTCDDKCLEKERSELTVGMAMAYEAGLSDRDQWKARCEAAEAILSCVPYNDTKFNNVYLPGMDEAVEKHKSAIRAMEGK